MSVSRTRLERNINHRQNLDHCLAPWRQPVPLPSTAPIACRMCASTLRPSRHCGATRQQHARNLQLRRASKPLRARTFAATRSASMQAKLTLPAQPKHMSFFSSHKNNLVGICAGAEPLHTNGQAALRVAVDALWTYIYIYTSFLTIYAFRKHTLSNINTYTFCTHTVRRELVPKFCAVFVSKTTKT